MAHRPTTRYRSLSTATSDGSALAGLTQIDGMDVIDEQVVVLAPLDVVRRIGHRGITERARFPRGADHALG